MSEKKETWTKSGRMNLHSLKENEKVPRVGEAPKNEYSHVALTGSVYMCARMCVHAGVRLLMSIMAGIGWRLKVIFIGIGRF